MSTKNSRGGLIGGLKVDNDYRPGSKNNKTIFDTANDWNRQGGNPTPYKPTQNSNFFTDVGRGLGNFFGPVFAPGTEYGLGTGFGDYLLGSDPNRQPPKPVRGGLVQGLPRNLGQSSAQQQETSLPDLQSFLAQAMELLGGGEELGRISYDPARADARSRGAEYDAHLNAMYNQLQKSMRQDGTELQGAYQTGIDDTAARAAQSQQSIQGAGDAANERNMQQLQALGIGEAAGNIVGEGRDLNTQLAAAVQDAAARGQISGDALQANQASAQQANTSLVGAAGLEGNLQRARVQSELGSLLSQYDMEEQKANQQIDAQNAQMRQSRQGAGLNLAQALYGSAWDQQKYRDDLSREQYEMMSQMNQPNKLSQSMNFLQQLMGSPQFADQDLEAILPYIQALGGIGKLV